VTAVLLGFSSAAAHGDGGGGGEHGGHDGGGQVHTTIQAIAHPRPSDDGHGDGRGGGGEAEHGDGAQAKAQGHADGEAKHVAPPAIAPSGDDTSTQPTATTRSPNLGSTDGKLPAPVAPRLPVLVTTVSNPGAPSAKAPPTAPIRATAPAPVRPPATPPQPALPAPTPETPALPPLVLIPPLGLPAPPSFNSVGSSIGLAPLVVALLAMATLAGILGVRVLRRSR